MQGEINIMAIKLVYHTDESANGGISPFCNAIEELVKNRNVCIVSPYIGIDIFKNVTELASSWQLITDIEEWIKSDRKNASRINNFIQKNLYNIHNYRDIHAKVIMNEKCAFIGSANLTEKGLTNRVEMSVLIDDKEIVKEMHEWFGAMWINSGDDKSGSKIIEALENNITSIISAPPPDFCEPKISIPSKAPAIKSKLGRIGDKDAILDNIIKNNQQSHRRLVEAIKSAPGRIWINSYFDLVKEMIEFTGLTNDDPRLVMSITKSKKIPISINQRYVLKPYDNGSIGLVMPLEYNSQNYESDGVVFEDEDYFTTNKIKKARWLHFERKNKFELSEKIMKYWKEAVLAELKRGKISARRKYHEQIVYEAAMNLSYRNKLIEEAFSEN